MEYENEEDSIWFDLIDSLFELNYDQVNEITSVEMKIYQALQKYPNNISGMITLMYCQTMLGNRNKALSLASKIWEIGGTLEPFFEFVYIENLLNIGLLEMAMVLLKPRLENIKENINLFYPSLLKFAIATGNIRLLNLISEYPDLPAEDQVLFDFANAYAENGLTSIYKNIFGLIYENAKDYMCAYEYSLYNDRGFPEIVIDVYVNENEAFCEQLETEIREKITGLWVSSGREPAEDINIIVSNIKAHEGWNVDTDEDYYEEDEELTEEDLESDEYYDTEEYENDEDYEPTDR